MDARLEKDPAEGLLTRLPDARCLGDAAPRPLPGPRQTLARWRCQNLSFGAPIERAVGELRFPARSLS